MDDDGTLSAQASDESASQLVLALEVAAGLHGPVPAKQRPVPARREAERVRFAMDRVREQRLRAVTGNAIEQARLEVLTRILERAIEHALNVLDGPATHAPRAIAERTEETIPEAYAA